MRLIRIAALATLGGTTVGCRETPPEPQAAPVSAKSAEVAEAVGSTALVYRFEADASWAEQITSSSFSARDDEPFTDQPLMKETAWERYRVLDAGAESARVEVRVERLAISMATDGAERVAYDSASQETPPKNGVLISRLALVGVPIEVEVTKTGDVRKVVNETAYRDAATTRYDLLRTTVGFDTDEDPTWKDTLDGEIAAIANWGLRPHLSGQTRDAAHTWTHELTAPSLFQATIDWTLTHQLSGPTDGPTQRITTNGKSRFQETSAMAELIEGAEASLQGDFELNVDRGQLLKSTSTLTATIKARPQPNEAFEGGRLRMKRIVERVRLR